MLRRAAFFGLFLLTWAGCNGTPGVKQFGDGGSTVIRTDAAADARDAKVIGQEVGGREDGSAADAGGDAPGDASPVDDGGPADGGPCTGATDGTACDDGDQCTRRDTCQGGRCLGENPVVCSAADACHKAGVCRPDTGACDSPNEDDGKACDDGDKCTHDDVCKSGVCGGAAVVCLASDQCHQEGTCDPATGACASPAKAEGASCDDANKCTHDDVCKSGVCGGVALVCPAGDQCHTTGVCDAATGTCSNPAKADGVSCDDQDACTRTDACQAGTCKGGNLPGCMSSPTCKAKGECVEVSDCTGQADGTLCDDGNACTQRDTCMGGACLGGSPVMCKAADACHDAGACNSQTGACSNPVKANGTSCEDGNACTGGDSCQNGSCVAGAAKACAASDTCHAAGTCNAATGTCSNPTKANGAGCSDGNACTQTDVCMQGVCTGSNAKVCGASDQCHDAGTCTPATGVCTNPATRNGKVCDDKNACTSNESCQNGVCGGGTSLTCPAVACQVAGACAPATGQCSYTAAPNGTSCTDTDFCTTNESCVGGKCTAGGTVPCNDRLPCQSGQCSSAQRACVYTNVDGVSCSDGNACTGSDICRGGTCAGSATVACADMPCKVGVCDKTAGCQYSNIADGTDCSGGDRCNVRTCTAGVCGAATVPNCTSRDACLIGSCDKTKGCVTTPAPDQTTCSTGKACTTAETCLKGVCQGGRAPACSTTSDKCCGVNADGKACAATADPDCAAVCGNGAVEPGELCDTGITTGAGACPTACLTGLGCNITTVTKAGTCQAQCVATTISTCSGAKSDACCPAGCTFATDTDCDRCAAAPDISKGGTFAVAFDTTVKQVLPDDNCGKGVELFYSFTLAQAEWIYLDVLDTATPSALVPVALALYAGACPGSAAANGPSACGLAGDGTSKARCGSTFPVIDSSATGVLAARAANGGAQALPAGRYTLAVRLNGATPKAWTLRFDHVPTSCAATEMGLGAPGGNSATTQGTTCQAGADVTPSCQATNSGADLSYFAVKCPFRGLALDSCVATAAGALPTPVALLATMGSLTASANNPKTCAAANADVLSACAAPATTTACKFASSLLSTKDTRSGLLVVTADTAGSVDSCGLFGISATQP